MRAFSKLGIIAGAGDLPVLLAQHCRDSGMPVHVSRIKGMCDPRLTLFPGSECALANFGERMKALKADGVDGFFKGRCAHGPMIGQIRPAVKSRSNKGTGVGATFFPSPSQKG